MGSSSGSRCARRSLIGRASSSPTSPPASSTPRLGERRSRARSRNSSREQGATALFVSHDPATVEHADRVVHVRDGRVSDERLVADGGEDAVVVGRGGWLRLPEKRSAFGRHLLTLKRFSLEDERLVVAATAGEDPCCSNTGSLGAADRSRLRRIFVLLQNKLSSKPAASLRRFGSAVPLDGVTASFAGGRLHAVTGPSGSGKTTLLHLLAGLDVSDAGDVLLDGVSRWHCSTARGGPSCDGRASSVPSSVRPSRAL